MKVRRGMFAGACVLLICGVVLPSLADEIPKAAWRRPIGQPLTNAGTAKPALGPGHIDDGYWQGAPVGGFGAGTFSRSFRGDFSRWHLQPGVHKFQTVWANQFAMFQKSEDEASGTAKVLFTGHPNGNSLKGWDWDYPVGAGDYAALYPKAWFDYRWDKFPARVTVEQFSPILPDNYKETSYPVAVYRWHAENPTKKRITVSVLLSWENMLGWTRGNERDFRRTQSRWQADGGMGRADDDCGAGIGGSRSKLRDDVFAGGAGQRSVEYFRERWNAFEHEYAVAEQRRTVGGRHCREIYAGTRRKQSHSNGDFVGSAGDGVWFGAQVESPLHGFLWNQR